MMPNFSNDPIVNHAAYQRGKGLTLALVVGTALWALSSVLREFALQYTATASTVSKGNPWSNLIVSGIVIYFLCWSAWRGGKTSTGCLTIIYSLGSVLFVLMAIILVSMLLGFQVYRIKETGFDGSSIGWIPKGIYHGLAGNGSALAIGAWMLFGFWVLVRSEDARYYREMRQRGIVPVVPPPLNQPPKL